MPSVDLIKYWKTLIEKINYSKKKWNLLIDL
jgi:hypothetical protein